MRAVPIAAVACLLLAGCSADPGPVETSPEAEPSATVASASAAPEPTPSVSAALETTTAPAATGFYDAGSQADGQVAQLEAAGREADAQAIRRIAEQPVATWLGEWMQDVTGTVAGVTGAAADAGQVALFVVYAIPGRDCGLHSAGGVPEDQYLDFVSAVADGIEPGSETWIVLEPDALAQMGDCDGQGDRAGLLSGAAQILDGAGADVFLDAGHSGWHSGEEVIARLETVGTQHLAGFSTNTSNYQRTEDERAWAEPIAAATGLEFIVDTSRNGNGSNGEWCNPSGRAIGEPPRILDDGPMRAVAWVKAPGESDGTCNGGPAAGQWWMEGALALAGAA